MPFKFKIDTPWGKKGDECPKYMGCAYVESTFGHGPTVNPNEYPDMFEKVEEKSDVEILVQWLYQQRYRGTGINVDREPWNTPPWILLAQKLIDLGFDVEKIK